MARADAQRIEPRNSVDSLSLAIVLYETALTNGLNVALGGPELEVVCVTGQPRNVDPPRDLIRALEIMIDGKQLIRPMSACRVEEAKDIAEPRSLIVDTLTSKRGILIRVGVPSFNEDGTFSADVGYYQYMLASATWACEGQRTERGWKVTSCRTTVVS